MDVCSHSVLSSSEDIRSFRELSVDSSLKSTCIVMVDSSVDGIGKYLTEHLSVHDDQGFVSGPVTPSAGHTDARSEIDLNPHQCNIINSEKCLSKSSTFPSLDRITPSTAAPLVGKPKDEAADITCEISKQNEDLKSVTSSYLRSISLPTPRTLISAMKGSREKQGTTPPAKLTVKWAPDVYDPIPTAVSHVVTNKPQRHNKKNSKNKQKTNGKNSKGSKSKDKKQSRKHSGSSSRGYKMMMDYDDEKLAEFDGPQPNVVDYNVGNGDQYCGSSFLKKSVTSLHFSVAEAT